MDKTIYIKQEDGQEVAMQIICTYEHDDISYVLVESNEEEAFLFRYDENGNLEAIEDVSELAIAEEILGALEDEETD